MKTILKRAMRGQKGAAFTMVLILLVLGGLILAPLLGLMSAGLMAGQVYEDNMHVLYAADAGIDDGVWQIRNVDLADRFPDYDEYDYAAAWEYYLDDHQGGVAQVVLLNDKNVHVTIENVWIPKDIPAPDAAAAEQIIEEGKLIIAGSASLTEASTYELRITYDPCGGAANTQVETLGIWLPPDFEYDGDCSLEGQVYYSEPDVTLYKGGHAVIWHFVSSILVKDFPDTVTFQYSGPQGQTPAAALSWIVASGDYYAWDADVKVYKISSTAIDPDTGKQTTVESYTSKVKPRKMGSAISGDYFAIGNTLMTCSGSSCPFYRNVLLNESSAAVASGDIPSTAAIDAAYLYWSGWIEESGDELTIFQDNCSDFNAPPVAWTPGTAWSTYSGEFRGNAYDEQPAGEWQSIWGPETCQDFSYPIMNWDAGSAWDTYNGRFRGTAYNKGYNPGRYVAMSSSIDLSAYAGQTIEICWDQDEDGDLEDSDRLYYAFSADGGGTWSIDYEAFRNDNPPSNFSTAIPDGYLTSDFRMRFHLYGFDERSWYSGTEYCFIDNPEISVFLQPPYEPPGRYLTMSSSIDLSAYGAGTVGISWQQDEDGDLEDSDRLYYAFSADGGGTWSADYEAFRNDNPPSSFSTAIPDEYLTNNFRIRFYLYGFDEGGYYSSEYCYIDDIIITGDLSLVETAKVNRVMFGTAGNTTEITTNQWQVAPTPDAADGSWCYRCFYDATDIVRDGLDSDTRTGTFTLGHVLEGSGYTLDPFGTTDYPLGTPALQKELRYQWSYAGWSLIIIYSSPETKGHQLFLFDTLRYVAVHTTLDFPISGFLVPDPVEGEQNAARITCFVGDGDEHYPYDFIALLDAEPSVPSYQIPDSYKLWDGITCAHNSAGDPNNVWNSQSSGLAASGIDIDDFEVTWSSGLLEPGDSSAWVVLGNESSNPSDAELIMVVYIIVSFRSAVTSGDLMGYLIRG